MEKTHGFQVILERLLSQEYKEVKNYRKISANIHDHNYSSDHPRYIEANTGCKHFDVHGGPEDIPVSRFSFDAKVMITKQ